MPFDFQQSDDLTPGRMPHERTFLGDCSFLDRETRDVLARHGITAVDDIRGRSPEALAEVTGLPVPVARRLVSIAELTSVPGLHAPLAELIVAAGVGSVAALAGCEAGPLADTLLALQTERKSRFLLPSAAVIEGWIAHARRDRSRTTDRRAKDCG